jgi:isoquinoline 1-oxidoreductase beta subunit
MNAPEKDQISGGQETSEQKWRISRRGFLIGMGITGTAFALGIPLGLPVVRRKMAGLMSGEFAFPGSDLNPLLWLEVLPDNRIRLFVPKAEMGQGTHTGLAQIAAEELEVPWEKLEVIHASTHQGEDKYRGTFGSQSIMSLYNPLRQASATMREMLRMQASLRLKQPVEKLIAREGGFEVIGDPNTRVSYGALVESKTVWQMPKKPVPLKPADKFKFIGQPIPRIDTLSKITGKAVFGHDVHVKGMLCGAVVRPPTIQAKMLSAQPGKAAGMPGVVKVVIEEGFAGVVAESRAQASAARDALEVKWERGRLWQQEDLEKIVTAGGRGGVNIQREGDAESVLRIGSSLAAEYRTGLVAHASLETQAALADVNAEGSRVWTSTQFETFTAQQVAKALGIREKKIEVIPTFLGGGFGRKTGNKSVSSVAAEAARLSRAVGRPVHVSWERAEEMRHGYFRPMTHHRLSAKLNGNGRIEAMAIQQASGDSISDIMPEMIGSIMGFDMGAVRGMWIHYAIPHRNITVWRRRLPIPTGAWRGLGLVPNAFPIESFMDELAYMAGINPLQLRLDHLPKDTIGQRMRAVLQAAADRADWGKTLPKGRAQGMACCFYDGTVVAEVAEVSLNERAGKIQVHRVVVAMDCGRAVNPNQVIAQIEGCVVMGTSAALIEEIVVKDGRVETGNFDQYPLLTLAEAPEVEAILLDAPDGKPRGAGEPPIGPVAPAIGNAFFSLTGVRLRQLPMTPERIKKALNK